MWRPWFLRSLAEGGLRGYTSKPFKRFFAGVAASLYREAGVPLLTDDELLAAAAAGMGCEAVRRCSEAADRAVVAWCRGRPRVGVVVLSWRRMKGLKRIDVDLLGDGSYMVVVDGVGASRIIVGSEGAVEENPLDEVEEEALATLWDAYESYGPIRMIDACRILEAGMGVDRAEARRILSSLVAKKLMRRHPGGYLSPRLRPPR